MGVTDEMAEASVHVWEGRRDLLCAVWMLKYAASTGLDRFFASTPIDMWYLFMISYSAGIQLYTQNLIFK